MATTEKTTKSAAVSTPAEATPVKSTPLPTRASALDTVLLAGGTWAELRERANAATKNLKTKIKDYPIGEIKTHIRYRMRQNKKFLAEYTIDDKGVFHK